jgi:hypothetical protein
VTGVFRFTSVLVEGGRTKLGKTVTITDAIFAHGGDQAAFDDIPSYETVFMSGFSPVERTGPLVKYIQPLSLKTEYSAREKPNAFFIFPPFNPEKKAERGSTIRSIPLRLMQRSFIDPELFSRNIRFRYPETSESTCFERGNYAPLFEIHREAIYKLEERESLIRRTFGDLSELALLNDVSEVISRIEELKNPLRNFNNVAAANSYTCAEQTGLDFIQDERVIAYLMRSLDITNPLVKGVLINIHCSDTPCSTCATSFARESQRGGIFKRISGDKAVGIVCSCRKHYPRKAPAISYARTTWLEGAGLDADDQLAGDITAPYVLNLDNPEFFSPMPVILLKHGGSTSSFVPNQQKYIEFVRS